MNEARIKRLRWKLILISFGSLSVTMLLIVSLLSGINYHIAKKNIRKTLQYIVKNGGYLPGSQNQRRVSLQAIYKFLQKQHPGGMGHGIRGSTN